MFAVALAVIAQGCSNDDDGAPLSSGTCDPTVQTAPDPAGAEAYCVAFLTSICDRGFADCVAEIGITAYFSSAAECRSVVTASCASDDYSNDWYDAPCGASCVGYVRTAPCSAFLGDEPQACVNATGSLPLACTATIGPGTFTDTISLADPIYDGGHARTYCISFSAGQSVVIQTSTPSSGSSIGDTVLHLLNPSGAQIAYNDDYNGLYSRISTTIAASGAYRIVVRGYSSSDTGSFDLTVTAF